MRKYKQNGYKHALFLAIKKASRTIALMIAPRMNENKIKKETDQISTRLHSNNQNKQEAYVNAEPLMQEDCSFTSSVKNIKAKYRVTNNLLKGSQVHASETLSVPKKRAMTKIDNNNRNARLLRTCYIQSTKIAISEPIHKQDVKVGPINDIAAENQKCAEASCDVKLNIWVTAFQQANFIVSLDLDTMKSEVSYSGFEVYQNYKIFRIYNKLLMLVLDDFVDSIFSRDSKGVAEVLRNEDLRKQLLKTNINFIVENRFDIYESILSDSKVGNKYVKGCIQCFKIFVCGQLLTSFLNQYIVKACSDLEERTRGYLSLTLVHDIENYYIDLSLMNTTLRGYQIFGAKFELAQRRTIIGDEMGLGKTLQALAAMCHMAADGRRHHFVVVCPASVLVNWEREVHKHTKLSVVVLQSNYTKKKRYDFLKWCNYGGICIITFDGAKSLVLPENLSLDMLVVDEAHYIKNPTTQRAKAIIKIIPRFHDVLFLTGTPLINNLEEFNNLVYYINNDIAKKINSDFIGGPEFRKIVAPVYLRREQSDVLLELPDRIDSEEWVEFDHESLVAYKSSIVESNFMAMRQSAYAGNSSSKLKRIIEIVHEAAENGNHVIIFSYFLKVLNTIEHALGDRSVGMITGGVAPRDRQSMIDRLAESKAPVVLLSQITAGGVGLNIQEASTVILAEPQWSPAIENQAVARCHRMGQRRTVMVYRILTENSVDQRMLELVRNKQELFDDYARTSDLRDATMDAIDPSIVSQQKPKVSVFQMEMDIIAQERARLGIVQQKSQ